MGDEFRRRYIGNVSTRVLSDVVRGQISFWLFTATCVALHPGFVLGADEGGMSNYGTHLKTFVPYTLALGATALYSLRAAGRLGSQPESRGLAWALRNYATFLLLVLASTYVYSLNRGWRDVHFTLAIALALVEVIGAAEIVLTMGRERRDLLFLVVQWIGVVLLVLTGFFGVHVLFLTQVAMAVGFGGLVVSASRQLSSPARASVVTMRPPTTSS